MTHLVAFALLLGLIFVNVAYAQEVFPRNAVQLGKAASGLATPSPAAASAAPAATATPTTPTSSSSSKPLLPKIKITAPAKGLQVPVGKDLTVSGTSIDNANSNCQVSLRVNKVRPYQPTTAAGTGGTADYSKWNFVLTSKYTTIKPGDNRITAKYQCANNPALTSFSSVNVIGIPAMISVSKAQGTTAATAPQSANVTNQIPQKPQTTTITTPTAAALPRPLPQLPKVTANNTSGSSSITATTGIPIVVQPLAGGICPQGYHLVSGSVCIKDIPTNTKTTPSTKSTPHATKSVSVRSPTTNQPNTNSANNDKDSADSNSEENFNTKILKSFNKEFKHQSR